MGLPSSLVLALAAGCTDPGDSGTLAEPRGGKTYRHSMDGAPASLDPAQAASIYANFLVVNLYDTLYRYKYLERPYQLVPNLAADMPEYSDDGLTITIRLKRGVHFTDDPVFPRGVGREVTADDVVYSIKRHFDPAMRPQGTWLWQGRIRGLDRWKERGSDYERPVEGLRAVDGHTLRIELTRPYPQLIHTLAQGYAAIVPREAVEAYGRELGSHPVGSGPFLLRGFNSARATLVRNPDFRREPFDLAGEGHDPDRHRGLGLEALEGRAPPFVDKLVIEFIAEDAARWNAFVSGQTQFVKVPVTQFSQVLDRRNPVTISDEMAERYHFEASLESGFVYTNFNMDDERIGYHPDPLQAERNRALRCAIIRGFDWRERNARFYYGIGHVFPGIIPPVLPEFDPDPQLREYVKYEPEQARRILRQHGWTPENLPILEYGFPSSVTERGMFEQFRSFMVEIGFPADKVRPMTFASYGDYARAYSQRRVMLVTSSWTMDYPDAENTVQLFYGPNASPGSNSSNFDNPEFNELYQRAASMPASPERTALFRAMNRIVLDDCVTISGLSRKLLFLWDRSTIMQPDRSFLGGFFLRFVDVRPGTGA